MKKSSAIASVLILTSVLFVSPDVSAQGSGQAYVVQPGDWLAKIAVTFYDEATMWPAIVAATNAKAREDSSYATIEDPNLIEVGQKLWIPDAAQAQELTSSVQRDAGELERAYRDAVEDAKIAEPGEISRNLTAIVASNEDLRWKSLENAQYVLVLTWTSWDGYDDQVGQSMTLTRQIWVTAVPELKDFCTAHDATQVPLTLRLEQLLGLPPNDGKPRFVEIWVRPDDLFRPSPDPEITDHEAGLDFHTSQYLTVSEAYVRWFDELKDASYGEKGYPWTRLGYTYDWGNPSSEVGLSEFIIDEGAMVEIHAVTGTEAYCK
jgi:hypothetical protein